MTAISVSEGIRNRTKSKIIAAADRSDAAFLQYVVYLHIIVEKYLETYEDQNAATQY